MSLATLPQGTKVTPARIGDWIQTYSGRQFWPLDARESEIDITDIAHSLSMQCRYNGHCEEFYSVAEHCVHVSYYVEKKNAMWGLLHDASEAYLCDIPRPLKPYLSEYKDIEANLMKVIAKRFNLELPEPANVKDIDNRIVTDEKLLNMKKPPVEWSVNFEPLGVELQYWTPKQAKYRFIDRYYEILDEMEKAA